MKRIVNPGVGKHRQICNRVQATSTDEERMVLSSAETCKRSIRRVLTTNKPTQPNSRQNLVVAPVDQTQDVFCYERPQENHYPYNRRVVEVIV